MSLLLAISTFLASANQALILIPPAAAGPNPPLSTYYKAEWVLWPRSSLPGGSNRLLSVFTGMDWQGDAADTEFRHIGGQWRAVGFESLSSRGYFKDRDGRIRTAVATRRGSVGVNSLLLASQGPIVAVAPFEGPWTPSATLIHEAQSWDEALDLARRAAGRSLIVEYPPEPGQNWGRYWIVGRGWPDGVPVIKGVAGLLPAKEIGSVLETPSRVEWRDPEVQKWGGANRWLQFVRSDSPWFLGGWGVLAALLAAFSLVQIAQERRSALGGSLLWLLIASPAGALLGGSLSRSLNINHWPVWHLLGLVLVATLSGLLMRLVQSLETHSLWPLFFVGWFVCVATSPDWSVFSNVFGAQEWSESPDALAFLAAYSTGLIAFRGRSRITTGIAVASIVISLVLPLIMEVWWDREVFALIPVVALVAGSGVANRATIALLAAGTAVFSPVWQHGVTWAPGGLLAYAEAEMGVNIAKHAQAISTPLVLACFGFIFLGSMFSDPFVFRQVRMLIRSDPRRSSMLWAGLLLAVMGLLFPELLYAGVLVILSGFFVLMFEGLRAL